MIPIAFQPIPKNLTLTYAGDMVGLPLAVQALVDADWQKRVAKNPKLQNGEVFTVIGITHDANGMQVQLAATNYAHYLYSQQYQNLGEHTVHIIHPAAIVITSDNKLIFGAMGTHTSRPGIIQCCGGGIDFSDAVDGTVQIESCIRRELKEELNSDCYDTGVVRSFKPAFLKTGGPTEKMTVIYELEIKQNSVEFLKNYKNYVELLKKQGEDPEFERLFCVERTKREVEKFITEHESMLNEYMAVLLRELCKKVKSYAV